MGLCLQLSSDCQSLLPALLSPRLSPLLVLNGPENSLHPDLLPPLARLALAAGVSGAWG